MGVHKSSGIRSSVQKMMDFVKGNKFDGIIDDKKPVIVDSVRATDICRTDVSTPEMLRCLIKNMKPFGDEMMVCISEKDIRVSEPTIRRVCSEAGVSITIKKRVKVSGVKDALCIRTTKEGRKKLMRKLAVD